MYWALCLSVFLATYVLNLIYITVFYHRGFTHGAVRLHPRLQAFAAATGGWITGLDVKGWCCMHRLHHRYSDTPRDPHSPVHKGFFGLAAAQLQSYKDVLRGLIRKEPRYLAIVEDLNFDVSWQNKRGLWYLPYLLHIGIAILLSLAVGSGGWLLGAAYFLGMMSHPVQGWMVNSMGHALGYRNYKTTDNSRNNTLVAWLVAGEGYQNNHHRYPSSVKFSIKWWEFDWGYGLCYVLRAIKALDYVKTENKQEDIQVEAWDISSQWVQSNANSQY